jgi:putative redox protein
MSEPVLAHSLEGTTAVELGAGTARWRADLDPDVGGAGNDPTPHQLLDSALAACTVLTMQLYAKRKHYLLAAAEVRIERDEDREVYRMRRLVSIEGALDDAQRADLLRVANACPIHKALGKRFEIATTLA